MEGPESKQRAKNDTRELDGDLTGILNSKKAGEARLEKLQIERMHI